MSSTVVVAYYAVVLVVGGLIAYAIYQRGIPTPIGNGDHRPGAHRPEARRDQHAARPAARPARSGAEGPQRRRVRPPAATATSSGVHTTPHDHAVAAPFTP